MKRPPKLLLLKNQRVQPFARSWIIDDGCPYGRTVSEPDQLGTMLRGDGFDVVLIDQRDSEDDLIETIEGVRQYQPQATAAVAEARVDAARAEKAREKIEAKLAKELERMASIEKAIAAERELIAERESRASEQISAAARREKEATALAGARKRAAYVGNSRAMGRRLNQALAISYPMEWLVLL